MSQQLDPFVSVSFRKCVSDRKTYQLQYSQNGDISTLKHGQGLGFLIKLQEQCEIEIRTGSSWP